MNTTTLPRSKKAKPTRKPPAIRTPTITLFVPQIIWFQELLNRMVQSSEVSLSTFLMSLIVQDLKGRGKLSASELEVWELRQGKQTRETKRGVHTKFTLYVPLPLNFLKKKIKEIAPTQSTYVWSLFVLSQNGRLTKAQIEEWHSYCTTPQRGSVSRERKAKILHKKLSRS